jgi:anti-anti-sigma factor
MPEIGYREYLPQWWELPEIQISYRHHRACLTIMLSGELDAFNCMEAYRKVREILTVSIFDRVVIDLADVDFCDCAGVRALVGMHYLATDRGAECVVRNIQDQVARPLHALHATAVLVVGPGSRPRSSRHKSLGLQ